MTTLHTPLCDYLGIDVPIIQAGMGRGTGSTTSPALVAAVSEAGGLGCLGATGWDPEEIREKIREVRALTARPFGVDLLLPASLADADVPRDDVRALVRRDHPAHARFMESLYERFAVDPSFKHPQHWALSPTLMRQQADVVLDCCDNFQTRQAINAACVQHRVPLVSGAAIGMDGQIAVYDPRDPDAPCYACVFAPSAPPEEARCATMGVLAPLVGVIGAMQAVEALKLLARMGTSLSGFLLMLDARNMEWTRLRVQKNPACTVCGAKH